MEWMSGERKVHYIVINKVSQDIDFSFSQEKSPEDLGEGGFSVGSPLCQATRFNFQGCFLPIWLFCVSELNVFPSLLFSFLLSFLPSLCHLSCTKMILLIALNAHAPLL